MKAIYDNKLYSIVDTAGDEIILQRDDITDSEFDYEFVKLSDPSLIVDPTDEEMEEI